MQKANYISSTVTDTEALAFHKKDGKAGKIAITPTKPLKTRHDLSLAYSPGVAAPCLEIQKDPATVYDYTSKGNLIAVVSNGTAVLGLGNLGALASKPVMEGKSVLFKRFADVDAVDIEVDTQDPTEFINVVKRLGASWGGINLEDIKAPECFTIEEELRKVMDIPVFHDDQHGTAIICTAGILNGAELTGKKISDLKVVLNGAGAAGISCVNMLKSIGVKPENIICCDSKGVIYEGRTEGMNQWKQMLATKTSARNLEQALEGADVFLGLSIAGALKKEAVAKMAKDPMIFAMANPTPEIMPEEAKAARPDAIIATGRSDYPNQINNIMGFPFIFRGALDTRASVVNEEMKLAAAKALAALAKEPVPSSVRKIHNTNDMQFGREYIVPSPFDPRLISYVSSAVAQAAMDSGVARKQIKDMDAYKLSLSSRLIHSSEDAKDTLEALQLNTSKAEKPANTPSKPALSPASGNAQISIAA